jgi:hypothetical protein
MSIFSRDEFVRLKPGFAFAFLLSVSSTLATEKAKPVEGTITATFTRAGMEPTRFVFTRKGNLLRIENTTNKLDPINIVDLAANELTIIYPHNTTFVRVDLNLTKKPEQPGAAPLPPSFPTPPNLSASQPGAHVGPSNSPPPGFPTLPSMPQMPNPGAGMAMPSMPMMPPIPGMFGPAELKKTDKTKKIQGFDCTLYTTGERGENFEIWATNDSALFPFRLIERDFLGRRFGPQMLEETWPEMLRNKSLFPVEATLKMEPGGQERLSFKIDKIDSPSSPRPVFDRTGKKIDNAEELFSPPKNYIEVQAPQI